jgi:response regulator RpfG family c-di-GMP phosphodiesterase
MVVSHAKCRDGVMTAVQSSISGRATRPRILCVDDEPHILESLRDTLRRSFDVHTAASGAEGLAMLRADPNEYELIISDMRMPVMSGSVFLREARRVAPDATRILLTGFSDLDAAVSAVNDAQLFRFLTKPCRTDELMRACAAGVGQHRLQTAERVLLEQTLKGSVQALADVLALASPAAFGRSERVRKMVERFALVADAPKRWEVEVAAMLVNLGAVTLPAATAEKLYAGGQLSASEQAMVARVPVITRKILGNIPRLDGVLEILEQHQRPFAESGPSRELSVGARILRIALDYDQLEAIGVEQGFALGTLSARTGLYDPELLAVFASVVGARPTERALELGVKHLLPGMLLHYDVRGVSGSLLIARGHTVTDQLIERLVNLGPGAVREPLFVLDVEPNQPAVAPAEPAASTR